MRAQYVATFAALTALSAAGCMRHVSPAQVTAPLPVTVARVRLGTVTQQVELTGLVSPKLQANLQSVVTGQVLAVSANVGDPVAAGEVLVRIDDSTIRAQVQQDEANVAAAQAHLDQVESGDVGAVTSAQANLASAQVAYQTALANLRRNRALLAQGYVSQAAVDDAQQAAAAAEAQLRSAEVAARNASLTGPGSAAQAEIRNAQAAVVEAKAALALAQAQLAQTVIRAPFDGILTQRSVDPGSLAGPGTPLVVVSQLDPVYVNVNIPETYLAAIHPGTPVTVRVATLPNRMWQTTVDAVNASTTQGTLSYLARIVLPNPGGLLKGGMVADASFITAEHRGVAVIPRGAVVGGEDGAAVYVVAKAPGCACDGIAKMVHVTLGLANDNLAEVRGPGIAPGVAVIVQRPDTLRNGSQVTIGGANGRAASVAQSPG
jgi:HlyD family secretion protein